ncbi:MAG: aldehyde dehydrogenase family protein, partial [Legionellaceae bacterium]
MSSIVPHWVGNQAIVDETTESFPVYNPATGELIASVQQASDLLCDDAVVTAAQAFEGWSQTPPSKRAQILFKFRALLERYQPDLARIVTREQGKTLDDAKGSIARAIELVEFHCGLLTQLQGVFSSNVATDIDCTTLRQPLGVCMGVSPFNFPVMVPTWMIIPAIACGNTFILKPSEQVPSAPIRLLEYLYDAGLPLGVANILQGNKKVVDRLIENPTIQAVTAVASTPVASSIYQKAIAQGKRAHTFGGAKNHAVVLDDANMEQTAEALVGAAFGSAGERCMAISVVVAVGDEVAE